MKNPAQGGELAQHFADFAKRHRGMGGDEALIDASLALALIAAGLLDDNSLPRYIETLLSYVAKGAAAGSGAVVEVGQWDDPETLH